MNKKQIVASLNKIANELDNSGLYAEASTVTKVMSRLAADNDLEYNVRNEAALRDPVMELSDVMDPEGTSNQVDDYWSAHNSITDALDQAMKALQNDPSIILQYVNEIDQFLFNSQQPKLQEKIRAIRDFVDSKR